MLLLSMWTKNLSIKQNLISIFRLLKYVVTNKRYICELKKIILNVYLQNYEDKKKLRFLTKSKTKYGIRAFNLQRENVVSEDYKRKFVLWEKDENNETLLVWTFPFVTPEQEQYVLRKYDSIKSQTQQFAFAKHCKEWCYITTSQAFMSDSLPRIKHFAFVIWAKDYNPEKYENLGRVLSKRYCKSGSPTVVLQLYLSVMTRGICTTEENGMFLTSDFEPGKRCLNTQIKGLVRLFGLEVILIYTALLLNKRLIIYHHSLESLLKWIQTIPYLMTHRNFNEITFPWIHLENDELVELRCRDGFIAGCIDNGIGALTEVYDLFINIPAREITISPHAREVFTMTKTHKDIALFMVQLSEKVELEESQVVEEISKKTQELLAQLRLLASVSTPGGRKVVSIETLRERNLAPALENFLFNLSVAEKMIML